jgi:cytochrome c peroxidase
MLLATSMLMLSGGAAVAQANLTPAQLRAYIANQAGGIKNLTVPPTDAEIPISPPTPGHTAYRYETTEAKRYLGKLLFHDPVRTARIDPTYGAVLATAQTGSCGSCHIGEAAGKAGQQLNFNVGGEGRGYTDEFGNFFARRRPRTDILLQQRTTQLFPGDALVDLLPTLTDVDVLPPCPGALDETNPARAHKSPTICSVKATGRLDPLDSVGRQSPSMIGFAFNNRLLAGGFAGQSTNSQPEALNPNNDPAQENLTLLLTDAHRMFTDSPPLPGEPVGFTGETAVLQKIPAFVKLFRDAFPEEAAQADAQHNLNLLVGDDTAIRATATFLRTVVTRNTPFDQFLAGNNSALTASQLAGAKLFFTPAAGGAGGAGCFVCHSGPMLNKQRNDPDVAGVGKFVEQNFINVGIGDHPIQALNRQTQFGGDASRHDMGRGEITQKPASLYGFKVPTLRQLKEAVTFFHDGSPRFQTVQDVVAYFNAGVPEDPIPGAAPTLDARFTNPRGPGFPPGLGLSDAQVAELADFIQNGLYDPALSHYDPTSPTRLFNLDPKELAYSKYRPDLAALGARDGLVLSGKAMDDNDPLTRRDEGFEFLDVTSRLQVSQTGSYSSNSISTVVLQLTNTATPKVNLPGVIDSASVIDTNLLVVVRQLDPSVKLINASGRTRDGDPYVRVFLAGGVLTSGNSITQSLEFKGASSTPSYQLTFLSGQGRP